jgi:enoyl-CoA hydratase
MDLVRLDIGDEGIATVTLNRPDVHNAITPSLFVELRGCLDRLATLTASVGCVVLTGAGTSFCAGDDLRAMDGGDMPPEPGFMAATVDAVAGLPQPVVAAVRGYCFAGGLELALACDFVIASDTAVFCDAHARWGFTPGWGASQRLPRAIGPARARELFYTGRRVDGPEAATIGLAARCVPDARLEAEGMAAARSCVAQSWWSLRAMKSLVAHSQDLPLTEGLAHEHLSEHFAPDAHDRRRRVFKEHP